MDMDEVRYLGPQVDDFIDLLKEAGMDDQEIIEISTLRGYRMVMSFGEFKKFATYGRIW